MDRQLKERLVGAAVLIAVAIIMVPEMFSGSGANRDAADHSAAAATAAGSSSDSGQTKTYRIELQHRDAVTASSENSAQVLPMMPDTHTDAAASTSVMAPDHAATAVPNVSSSSSTVSNVAASSKPTTQPASSAPVKPVVPATVPESVPASVASNAWAVQLGSFAAEATAKQIVTDAKSHGFNAYLASVNVGGKTFYRVRVGSFPDRDAASAALNKLKHSYAQASLVAPGH